MNNNGYVIEVSNLSKEFRVYNKPSDMFYEIISRKKRYSGFYALKDINFKVRKGETVGIIGSNGSGKSTLLKILAGTLSGSSGVCTVNGKISAILELGTGFHPQYTGRENVMMGGLCLGMTRDEIKDKLDWIIDFSELASVIDQPFHTYSSGMQARLTFSTAICVSPDIFIVDEALAAGDAYFVEKCLLRMEEIISSGCTVFIVSHNTNLISRFCKRAIWLQDGVLRRDGDAIEVSKEYEIAIYQRTVKLNEGRQLNTTEQIGLGDQKIRIGGIKLIGHEVGEQVFLQGEPLTITVDIDSDIDSDTVCFYIGIYRSDNLCVWTGTNYRYLNFDCKKSELPLLITKGRSQISMTLNQLLFNNGSYYINVGVEPTPDIACMSDYHDYKTRLAYFSVIRENDHLILSKVFDSPSIWDLRKVTSRITENCEQTI